jgi:hypothetical protein
METIANIIKENIKTTHLILDSTPLKDMHDPQAEWGYTSRGPVKGFKLHVAVNQLGLPLKAIITTANRFDSIFLPQLIEDIKAQYVLADAGYHSLKNLEIVKASGAVPVIAVNPRRKGKECKVSNASFLVVGVGLWSSLMVTVKPMCLGVVGLGRGVCLGSRLWCWLG